MAEEIVIKGLGMLAKVTLAKAIELYQASDGVEPMQQTLGMIEGFLKYADSKPHKNDCVKGWVNAIRNVAYRIEDAIDVFFTEIEEDAVKGPSTSSVIPGKAKSVVKHPQKLDWLQTEIKATQKALADIKETATQLGLPNLGEETSSLDADDDSSYYLKQCFRYFAAFPKGDKISAKQITRMWIAEGFITRNANGTLEEKAESYLKELVKRRWIDVIENSGNGKCRYCMPDLSRDQAIQEAEDVNLFMVLSQGGGGTQQNGKVVRRAAMQSCTLEELNGTRPIITRSLLFFGGCISNSHEFRLLRVLNIQGNRESKINISCVEWLEGLIHLKYLGIRNCRGEGRGFSKFSFSSFKKVETVDLKGTNFKQQPHNSIWKIPTLRHVIYPQPTLTLSEWDPPKNLQTLKVVDFENFLELKCNPKCNSNVGKIGLSMAKDFGRKDEEYMKKAQGKFKNRLGKMNLLVSLHINGGENFILFPTDGFGGHKNIQNLRLRGEWPKNMVLDANTFPKNLTKLSLSGCLLEKDPMSILEGLRRSLRILKLGKDTFVGTEMTCSKEGFLSLEELCLRDMDLESLHIEEGAMPNLSKLQIGKCTNLKELPELQNVPNLQVLIVIGVSKVLREWMESAEFKRKTAHIRSVVLKE